MISLHSMMTSAAGTQLSARTRAALLLLGLGRAVRQRRLFSGTFSRPWPSPLGTNCLDSKELLSVLQPGRSDPLSPAFVCPLSPPVDACATSVQSSGTYRPLALSMCKYHVVGTSRKPAQSYPVDVSSRIEDTSAIVGTLRGPKPRRVLCTS